MPGVHDDSFPDEDKPLSGSDSSGTVVVVACLFWLWVRLAGMRRLSAGRSEAAHTYGRWMLSFTFWGLSRRVLSALGGCLSRCGWKEEVETNSALLLFGPAHGVMRLTAPAWISSSSSRGSSRVCRTHKTEVLEDCSSACRLDDSEGKLLSSATTSNTASGCEKEFPSGCCLLLDWASLTSIFAWQSGDAVSCTAARWCGI